MKHLLAVDWGTSSLRGAWLDGAGQVLKERTFARGILTVAPGDFPSVFEACFGDWMQTPDAVCLMSGMVGSQQGWLEAPYCTCPAGELATQGDADDSDDHAERGGQREQEDGFSAESADGESVVALDATHRVGRGEAEHEHRQSPADAADEETRHGTGRPAEQQPPPDERKARTEIGTARWEGEWISH